MRFYRYEKVEFSMRGISSSLGFISGVVKHRDIEEYNKTIAGRSLLAKGPLFENTMPWKIHNPRRELPALIPIRKNGRPATARAENDSQVNRPPVKRHRIEGNTFSGGLVAINNRQPPDSGAPPRYCPADSALPAGRTLPINPLQTKNQEDIWQVKQGLRTMKEKLAKEILRNNQSRRLIQLADEAQAHRQEHHLHASEITSAHSATPHQCQICALLATYHQLLTVMETAKAQSGVLNLDQDGQRQNSDTVLLTLASVLHHLIREDSDKLLDVIRSLAGVRIAGLPDSQETANKTATRPSPDVAAHLYEVLTISPSYLEKTWQIKDHIIKLLEELNKTLAQNTGLRRLMGKSPLTAHADGHVHTFTLQDADMQHPDKCNICVFWTHYNNFFQGLKRNPQPCTSAKEYHARYRDLNSGVFKLTHTLLSMLKKDNDTLLDSLAHHAITADNPGDPPMKNISWADITAALTIDPKVVMAGSDMPRINPALGKMLNIESQINRIKSEFADMLSLDFRLRQQLAQHSGPGTPAMHFHANASETIDYNTAHQCYFCRLCTLYNRELYPPSRPDTRLHAHSSGNPPTGLDNHWRIFSLTHLLLTHLKNDTQTLQDSLPYYRDIKA
ncbi:hypothetical protein [Sodalis sp. C49]|uniref:hypothetical protein n=1 Tax=Sodalis sp. C49 TaxID=3228929 RepID=UPI003965B8D9